MVVDSAPERLLPRLTQPQTLAVLAHPVLVRPVDKKGKKYEQMKNFGNV